MKGLVVPVCVLTGGFGGYQVGLWWLDRTVQTPELESAVYPGIGTIAGSLFGLALGLFIMWLSRARR